MTDNEIKPLRNIVGEDNVSTYSPDRAVHSLGKSYLDLICLRRGNILHPTDALVYPATETEIEKILKRARERHWIVIPFGGGTSVVGGIEPSADARPVIRVDLRRLNKILQVDTESWLATVQCRIFGPVG
ncbi:MAG: FAD-binding oxidoreductase [Acidobacteriota bacterium]